MDAARIKERLIAIIIRELDVEQDKVVPSATFVDDLGSDSLDIVELVMALEEEFDIEVSDEDAEKMITVEDTLNYILKQVAK
jgi:acyl carrier protein